MGKDPSAGRLREEGSRKATEPEARTATGQGARAAGKVWETGQVSLRSSTFQERRFRPEAEPKARQDLPRPQSRRSGVRPARHSVDHKLGREQDMILEEVAEEGSRAPSMRPSTAGFGRRRHRLETMRALMSLLGFS